MEAAIIIVDKMFSIKLVQWFTLALIVLLLAGGVYSGLKIKWLQMDLKVTKADLAWVKGALDLQNEAVKRMGEEQKTLEEQKKAKGVEAAKAKATAAERAAEIMRLKMSKDCKEVTAWGLEQALSQSRW